MKRKMPPPFDPSTLPDWARASEAIIWLCARDPVFHAAVRAHPVEPVQRFLHDAAFRRWSAAIASESDDGTRPDTSQASTDQSPARPWPFPPSLQFRHGCPPPNPIVTDVIWNPLIQRLECPWCGQSWRIDGRIVEEPRA